MKKNNQGSALVWAISVVMVLTVVVGAVLSFSFAAYDRSINNKTDQQAQTTAQCAIETLVNQIELDTSDSDTSNDSWFLPANSSSDITDITIKLPNNLDYQATVNGATVTQNIAPGTIKSVVVKRNDTTKITIQVTATALTSSSENDTPRQATVKATMKQIASKHKQWILEKYDWGDQS